MVKVGVIGLGMMGLTHLDAYRRRSDVQVVAICDSDPDRLSGKVQATGNVEGQAQSTVAELQDVRRCTDAADLIGNPQIDLVDVCLPTDLHVRFGIEVLQAGQHLMIEKPLARSSRGAARLAAAADEARGMTCVAHCMRFWPGWSWLKEAIDDGRFGRIYGATFRRVVNHPGGPFYSDGDRCGGAALDLHYHDTDFVQFCFGMPRAVTSFGYSKVTDQPDHLITRYEYERVPLVVAEGSWAMADGFTFNMTYTVNFERATAVCDLSAENFLMLYETGSEARAIELPDTMGYDLEIDYFMRCVQEGRPPEVVTVADALNTVRIVEAEVESVATGRRVTVGG